MANLYTSENYLVYDNGTDVFPLSKSSSKYSETTVGVHIFDSSGISFDILSADVGSLYNDSTSTNLFADWDAVLLFLQQNTGFFLQIGYRSTKNSSSDPLDVGATFTGVAELNDFPEMLVQVATDQDGLLTIELSDDGTNWDTVLRYNYVVGNINPAHRIVKGIRYARTTFQNTSGIAQTELRLHCSFGSINPLTSSVNSTISQNFDALVTRPLDFNMMASKGLYEGHRPIRKDGLVSITTAGSVSETAFAPIWLNGSSLSPYTGFPASEEPLEIVVAGADIGTVYYSYLENEDSDDYVFGSIAISGAGSYLPAHDCFRCGFAYFECSTRGTTNAGAITLRQSVTTANIFCIIRANEGQTYCSAHSTPKTSSGHVDRITGAIRGGNNTYAEGFFYFAKFDKGYTFRYPFTINQSGIYFDDGDFMDKIGAGYDVMPVITKVGANNTTINVMWRFIQVKE